MKRVLKIIVITTILLLPGTMRNDIKAQVSVGVSFQVFYDELSPYGRWISYPHYGYVWCPNEMYAGFHPYQSDGRWVWTDEYGWMWVSDYEWGWATFHYGRWLYDPFYGWLWVPDYEWAPAWVIWRSGGGYYGWAPMSPGISISMYFSSYRPPNNYWCFAPRQYITSPHISNYIESINQNTRIINNTTIINNYNRKGNVFVTGPSRTEAERYANSKIVPMYVRESGDPGKSRSRKNEVTIYKPDIRKGNTGSVAPKRFERYKDNNRDNQIFRRGNLNNPGKNKGGERAPDVKMKQENEKINSRGVNEKKPDNNKILQRKDYPINGNEKSVNRNYENKRESKMYHERNQKQEINKIPQSPNKPAINRESRKQQRQQPDFQSRKNPGRGSQQIKNPPQRQQPGNKSNEKSRGNKKGKG